MRRPKASAEAGSSCVSISVSKKLNPRLPIAFHLSQKLHRLLGERAGECNGGGAFRKAAPSLQFLGQRCAQEIIAFQISRFACTRMLPGPTDSARRSDPCLPSPKMACKAEATVCTGFSSAESNGGCPVATTLQYQVLGSGGQGPRTQATTHVDRQNPVGVRS